MPKINLSRAVGIAMGGMLLGCVLNSAAALFTLSQLKVGGPVYQRVILGKDLVADILPPPEYLIEAFLEVNLARDDAAGLEGHAQRLKQLRKDYDERHDYWVAQPLEPAMRDMLLRDADAPARRFWTLAFDSYLPALARGGPEADHAFHQLKAAYGEHRAAIDRLVTETNRFTAATEAQAAQSDRLLTWVMIVFGVLALLVTFATYLGVAKLIVRPIAMITDAMTRMARGDLIEHAPFIHRRDEVGAMGRAVEVFLANEHDRRRLAETEKATRRKEMGRQDALEAQVREFAGAIGASVAELGDQTGAMRMASSTLNEGAASVKSDAQRASVASTDAATNSQAVAAATVELEASIREIAGQAERARVIVDSAAAVAGGASRDMEGLTESSRQIDAILELIRTIAGRTNLLALNATIEAARAGESGRGFAVVANEVKSLSEQTGRAVDEIAAQIGRMHQSTGTAVAAIAEINGKVADIREMTLAIADAVSQQDEATREIARNVTRAAERSDDAALNVRAVTVTAEKTDSQAGRLASASESLARTAQGISAAMERFVGMVQNDLRERRAALRQNDDTRVEVEAGGRRATVRLETLSESGAKLSGAHPFKVGENATIHLEGRPVAAQVVWASEGGCGLEFAARLERAPESHRARAA
jgi:methyl-accepting chemotaxis protein